MNKETRQNDFDNDDKDAPEQRPLDEHLEGITERSPGVQVKAAAESALADRWSRADVRAALVARGVGPKKLKDALPPLKKPHVKPSAGLSPGFFPGEPDGPVYRMGTDEEGEPMPVLVCSPIRALYRTSDIEGMGWALVVQVTDERGVEHDVALPYSLIQTEPSAAVARLCDAGLEAEVKPEIVLAAIRKARPLPRAYFVTAAGRHDFGDAHVFVLPGDGRVFGEPPPGDVVLWRGNPQYCKTRTAGTFDGWKTNAAAPVNGFPIAMAAIGTMLASPGIRHLPTNAEPNTTLHLVGDSSLGKTTSLQIGASVWGMGAKPEVPGSFLNSWKNTRNNMENLLSGTCDIGGCIDEIKTLDEKSGRVIAYDIALGQGKGRMYADGSPRPTKTWNAFFLSSGELSPDELGDPAGRRQGAPDAGAEVRFINIPGSAAFPAGPGQTREDVDAFVIKLGAAASTDYGHAGPMFVKYLMANPAGAERRIHDYWDVWGRVAKAVLPLAASRQAARVASRLGSIACIAALAAQGLKLPLPNDPTGKVIDDAMGEAKVAAPARACCGRSPKSWRSGWASTAAAYRPRSLGSGASFATFSPAENATSTFLRRTAGGAA